MKPRNLKNIEPRKLSLRKHMKDYWTSLKNKKVKRFKELYY
jgi:hypothetical protein